MRKLREALRYDEVSGLLLYVSLAIVFLYISFLYPQLIILYIGYLVLLYKRNKILFVYAIIISLFLGIIYLIYYIVYQTYQFSGSVSGIVAFQGDSYILLKQGFHYLKVYTNYPRNLVIGYRVKIIGIALDVTENNIPQTFSYYRYKLSKSIIKEIKMISYIPLKRTFSLITLRGKIIAYIETHFSSNTVIYLKELVLGISSFDDEVMNGIKETGIAYLFAISGLHIQILSRLIDKGMVRLNIPEEIGITITIIFLITYALITVGSVSIYRAVVMCILEKGSKLFKKHPKKIDILSISLTVSLLMNPFQFFGIGFFLTYFSTLAIFLNEEKGLFKTTLTVLSLNLPFLMYFNHSIPFFIVIYSFTFGIIFSCFLIPFTYLTIVFYPLGFIYEGIAKVINLIIIYAGDISPDISYSIVNVYFLIAILFMIFAIFSCLHDKNKLLKNGVILVIILVINLISGSYQIIPSVRMLDVGQGDSFLLRSGFKTVLIDTGKPDDYNTVITYLKSQNIYTLDALYLSHGDSDHDGEYDDIRSMINVKRVCRYINGEKAKYGVFQFITYSNEKAIDDNNRSMVIFVKIYNQTYLFTGDIEKEGEDFIMGYDIKNITYLKISHHGSSTSSNNYFLEKMNPEVSLISVGLNNRYGHPNSEVIKRLDGIKSFIYRSDINGTVSIFHYPFFSISYAFSFKEIFFSLRTKKWHLVFK